MNLLNFLMLIVAITFISAQIYSSNQIDKYKINPFDHWCGISVWGFAPILIATIIVCVFN